jgi:hypothetical protein
MPSSLHIAGLSDFPVKAVNQDGNGNDYEKVVKYWQEKGFSSPKPIRVCFSCLDGDCLKQVLSWMVGSTFEEEMTVEAVHH